MADDEDTHACGICGTHFTTAKTLGLHMAAIHKEVTSSSSSSIDRTKESNKRARSSEGGASEEVPTHEHVELAPILGVLSDSQKDALILRAVQRDPDFFGQVREQVCSLLTEEAADARLSALDPQGIIAAVRWYLELRVPANALTLLVAASQRCLCALERLIELPTSSAGSSAVVDEDESEGSARDQAMGAVEALPAAGALGALWSDLLKDKAVVGLVAQSAEELHQMLNDIQSVAGTVRPSAPGLLVGPGGETVERVAEAMRQLETISSQADATASAGRRGSAKGKQKHR